MMMRGSGTAPIRHLPRRIAQLRGLSLLALLSAQAQESEKRFGTIKVTADAIDLDDSRPATVSTATKTALDIKDVPQTINSLKVSKFKVYGINDLSVLLDGVRGDGVTVCGFSADSNDIYDNRVRASGQIRRSTANVESIEILKGPA